MPNTPPCRLTFVLVTGILLLGIGADTLADEKRTELPDAVRHTLERVMGGEVTIERSGVRRGGGYDKGSIGRKLHSDEWRASQAWQALSGYNCAKQARHHDIDSMVWCTLRGGGNSVTYMKPLIDFHDHAKLAFYTYGSALQPHFASSKGVDVVYGPHDKLVPVIMSLGEGRVVDLAIDVIDPDGNVAAARTFRKVELPAGRPMVELEGFRPDIKLEGNYAVTFTLVTQGKVIGRTFEMKRFSNDPQADGDTDFDRGEDLFDVEQLVDFLKDYAAQACRFYDDPNLDTKVVTDSDVEAALAKLKPQPLPEVRKRLVLHDGWKSLARRAGETEADVERLATWVSDGVDIRNEQLVLTKNGTTVTRDFAPQDWRFFLQWTVVPVAGKTAAFTLSDGSEPVLSLAIDDKGNLRAGNKPVGSLAPGEAAEVRIEVDLQYSRFTVYVDGERTLYAATMPSAAQVTRFTIEGSDGLAVDDIWGVGYHPAGDIRNGIYDITTYIDEDFSVTPGVEGWETPGYEDSAWAADTGLPFIVGSERNAGRDIYLRRTVQVGRFDQALLTIDALDPSGEVFINGKPVAELNRRPTRLDVTEFLRSGSNLIAVKVDHVKAGFYPGDGHTSRDLLYGWFSGRIALDLTAPVHVDDVFVYTEKLGDPATVKVVAELANQTDMPFEGEAIIRFFPWYPSDSERAVLEERVNLKLEATGTRTLSQSVLVPDPLLWDVENPNLYKVSVTLVDGSGAPVDDEVVTTGLRTISEEGGTFCINGKPAMLNGATWMQFPAPLTESTTWHRCCPKEWIVKGILQTKAMHSNVLRKHEPSCSYSDPRFAEIGDQLGFMYIWVSTGWNRKHWTRDNKRPDGSKMPLQEQVEEYVANMKQIRNCPSVAVWEIFNEGVGGMDDLYKAFYPAIHDADPSRFIMPLKEYYRDEPRVIKGGQIDTLGYGKRWGGLRKSPADKLGRFTGHPEFGMYAVEFAEVVGQDNWDLVQCKPWHKVHSYEWDPDIFTVTCAAGGKTVDFRISEEGRVLSMHASE